jgi:TatD DNase family protein
VIHSYSGAPDLIPALAAHGAFFSFSGSVTRPHNKRARTAVTVVPPDRLLIETDAPDLMPFAPAAPGTPAAPLSDGPNEPANLPLVRDAVAALRGMPPDELADLTFRNALRAFGLQPQPTP